VAQTSRRKRSRRAFGYIRLLPGGQDCRWTTTSWNGGHASAMSVGRDHARGRALMAKQTHKCPAVLTTNTRQFQEQRVNGTGQSAGPDEFGCHVAQLCVGSL
jgi:hypothetical protein